MVTCRSKEQLAANVNYCEGERVQKCKFCLNRKIQSNQKFRRWQKSQIQKWSNLEKESSKNQYFSILTKLYSVIIFFMMALQVEFIFLTTFYGLYFNHQFSHITLICQVLTDCYRPLWAAIMYCFKHLSFDLWVLLKLYSFDCSCSAVILESVYRPYFHWKILTLAGIWTQDLPGTKSICYQLSYPGLNVFCHLLTSQFFDFSHSLSHVILKCFFLAFE